MQRRTLLTAGLAAAAVGAGLTACSKAGAGGDADDLATVRLMIPVLDSQAPAADGALQSALQTYTGKTFDVLWVPNASYGDRTNVVLASDDIPEVMVIQGKTPNFVRSAQAGAFWDLSDKLDAYSNLKTDSPQVQKNASINGTVYGIYRQREAMRTAVIVRKDWLDEVGLAMPNTTQDLYTVAKAFKTENPGGASDPCGLIIPKWPGGYGTASPYDVMETWYGAPNAWGERNGALVPGFDTEEFLEANVFMKKMIDEGLVNADFATLDSGKWNEPFFTGKGGLIIDVASRGLALLALFKQDKPDDYAKYVDMTGNLVGPSGDLLAYPTTGYNGFVAISRQSVQTEAELADVLTFLDKLNAKEGQTLLNNGIEGKNYSVDDDYAVAINPDDSAAKVISNDTKSFAQLGMAVSGYQAYTAKPAGAAEKALDDKRLAFNAADLEKAVNNPTLALVSDTYVSKGAQLDQIIGDARIKFLAGQLSTGQLSEQIKRWHSSGGDDIITEMNELYAKTK